MFNNMNILFHLSRDVIASLNLPESGDLEESDPPLYTSDHFIHLAGSSFLEKSSIYSVIAR